MFRLQHDGAVARLTLDRPEARNAIALDGWAALAACLETVAASDARLLVVAGAGGSYCAGADLKDFPLLATDEAARLRFRTEMRAALDRLAGLAMPTLAVIDGPCFGAGVALAMACDLRLARAGARFAITPAKLGIAYPQEDVRRLVALVGPGQAARLLLTAGEIGADEAARIGLVEAVDADEEGIVSAIVANAPASLAALKQAIRLAGAGVSNDPAQDALFDALIAGPDMAARLEALRRK